MTYDIALVGTGNIATAHAGSYDRLGERVRVVAAVDTQPEALQRFGDRYPQARLYSDLDAMLDRESPDLVDLCTPPGLHLPHALNCLGRGRDVLCEKPPALSLAEMDQIAEAERTGGGRFSTVFQHRFGSGAGHLRQLIGDGRLGRPLTAVCNTLWFRPDEYFAVPWRGRWDIEGGGPTMGHGIHQMDLMLYVLGDWQSVLATAHRQARPTATEDLSCAIVGFANGAVATVVNSLLSPRETSYLRFDFEHATVELEHLYGYGDSAWRVTAAKGHEAEVDAAWADGPTEVRSGHLAQLTAIFDALDKGEPPPVVSADSRATLELVAGIYASSFGERMIRRGELGPGSPFYTRMEGDGTPWPADPEPVA